MQIAAISPKPMAIQRWNLVARSCQKSSRGSRLVGLETCNELRIAELPRLVDVAGSWRRLLFDSWSTGSYPPYDARALEQKPGKKGGHKNRTKDINNTSRARVKQP